MFLSRPPRTLVVVLLATSCLGACASVPTLPPNEALKAPAAYAADESLAAPVASWPSDQWWTAYGDPQLDSLISEALSGAPDLAAARARVARAQAGVAETGAALLPTVGANGNVQSARQSYNNGIPPAFVPVGYNDTGRATLDFTYELDFFGKNRAALAAATSDTDAARADLAEARLVLSTNVATTYAQLSQLFAERDAAQAAADARDQLARLTAQRYENGLENLGSTEQAQANLASARGELAAIDELIDLNRNRLAALLGAGPDRGRAISRPKVGLLKAFGLPANLKADLIGRRPDVVAARLRAEAAAQRIKQARARFYPDVDLSAYFGQQALGLDLLSNAGSRIGAIGPAIHLPIFEGGSLRAGYSRAEADYEAAVAAYNSAVAHALQDVADAAVSSRALDTRLLQARAAAAAMTKAYDIALRRYSGGLSTYLDVLAAEDAMISSQRRLSDLETRAFTLDVALVRALGGGFRAA